MRTLILSKPDGPLVPNLHSLDWSEISQGEDAKKTFPYIRLFLGPSVKHLVLNLHEPSTTNLSVIHSLLRDHPGITHLDLEETSSLGDDTVSDAVCQWNKLQSFIWQSHPHHAVLLHLANLSNLQDISIFLPALDSPSWKGHISSFRHLGFRGFRALRNAKFRCQNISSCALFMDLVSSQCPIECMAIGIYQAPSTISLRNFFQTLNARCSQMTLTKLTIIYLSHRWPRPPFADQHINIIDEATFQPLLGFSNMRHIIIRIPCPFRLGNETLQDITRCWTQLRTLTICGPDGWGGCSRITLAGLISLLSLSKLDALGIVVDASSVNHTVDMPKTGVPNTKLSTVHFGDSVIHDAPSVAAWLSDVLPNVKKIHSWGVSAAEMASVSAADAMKYQSRWEEVASLIEAAAKVREQGRDSVGNVLL